ncbi:lecithin retinol acyltransferase family protein (plasmid) [Pseudomonas luteola]|uniref:lecithin retinol acyltransferase family protein n=1 Tax=Pseudomonas TaxID=286 RepID=UPI003D9FB890
MHLGDHLISRRTGYTHHGIHIGNNQVIHYSGFAKAYQKGPISITSIEEFRDGQNLIIKKHPKRKYNSIETITRALGRLGEGKYNLIFNNCEHFVNWCIHGSHRSHQVEQVKVAAGTAVLAYTKYGIFVKPTLTKGAAVVLLKSMGAKQTAGPLATRILSMAQAVTRINTTSSITGTIVNKYITVNAANLALVSVQTSNGLALSTYTTGAVATAIGGGVALTGTGVTTGGTGTAIAAVAVLGAPSFGVTGITSGLAAVGTVVGGGVGTGLLFTAAAPLAVGAAAYGLYKWLSD